MVIAPVVAFTTTDLDRADFRVRRGGVDSISMLEVICFWSFVLVRKRRSLYELIPVSHSRGCVGDSTEDGIFCTEA